MDLSAPDGSNQPINSETVQWLNELPAFSLGFLYVSANANWEEGAILYLNEVRQPTLFGNYDHFQGKFWLPQQSHPQTIQVAGWHKMGRPSGRLPWVASRGIRAIDGFSASWNDSGADQDFDDIQVQFTILPGGIHTLTPLPALRSEGLQPTDPDFVAQALVQLAAFEESRQLGPSEGPDSPLKVLAEARSQLLAGYRAHYSEASPHGDHPGDGELARQLYAFANTLQEGELRAKVLAFAEELLDMRNRA